MCLKAVGGMRTLFIILSLCVPVLAHAQRVSDEQLWVEAGIDAGLGPDVRLEATQELRLGIDAGYDETHTQLEAKWSALEYLRVGALYRVAILDNEVRHRVAGQVELRGTRGSLTATYRLKLQETFRADYDQLMVRNRGRLALGVTKHVEPFFALELHHQLDPVGEFRELRLIGGVDWELTKRLDLATYYIFQDEANVRMPERNYILGASLTYHLGDLRHASEAGPSD